VAAKALYHRIMTSVLLAEDDVSISDPLARALRRATSLLDVDVLKWPQKRFTIGS